MRKFLTLSLVAALVLAVGCSKESPMSPEVMPTEDVSESASWFHGKNFTATYKVVIENMTPNNGNGASQPFSPPIVAAHSPFFHIYKEGWPASYALGRIAEDAESKAMLSRLGRSPLVNDYVMGGGVILPGQQEELMVEAKLGFGRLSIVGMLVNTNDGFVGADGIRLPVHGSKTIYLDAYDAGTEKNTELTSDIPGPCCGNPGVRVPERKRVRSHDGIMGSGDLVPAVWGWSGAVAKVTITRVNPV